MNWGHLITKNPINNSNLCTVLFTINIVTTSAVAALFTSENARDRVVTPELFTAPDSPSRRAVNKFLPYFSVLVLDRKVGQA